LPGETRSLKDKAKYYPQKSSAHTKNDPQPHRGMPEYEERTGPAKYQGDELDYAEIKDN